MSPCLHCGQEVGHAVDCPLLSMKSWIWTPGIAFQPMEYVVPTECPYCGQLFCYCEDNLQKLVDGETK